MRIPLISLVALMGVAVNSAAARDAGRQVWRGNGCVKCHAVGAAGIEARGKARMRGPDLGGLAARYQPASLATYLKQDLTVAGRGAHGFKGTDEELQALVDWLLEQK